MHLPLALLAEFLYPMRRSNFEFGMVLVLPRPINVFKRFDLLKASKFFLGRMSEECATSAFSDQAVDFADKWFRDDDVCASSAH
jgi:hypothetical protein